MNIFLAVLVGLLSVLPSKAKDGKFKIRGYLFMYRWPINGAVLFHGNGRRTKDIGSHNI